jgi:hypothetical protein
MINEIMNAISKILKDEFGIKIYINQVPQGFAEPCFFIRVIRNSETQIMDFRYRVTTTFEITYISDENDKDSRTINEVVGKLNNIIDFITLENGDVERGTDRKTELQDGDLHSFVQFTYFAYKERQARDKMEELEHKGGIKDNG